MNKLIKILPLLATCVGLVGCQDEDFGYTASEIREHANFVEVFGKPDPEHTWSTAEYRYINVNVQYPAFFDNYQCRVWTANPSRTTKNLYYMADLTVENGQSTKFGIDCPADLQTVYVSLTDAKGGTIIMPATFDKGGNASVNFGEMTRANIHLDVVNAEKGTDFDVDVYYHDKTESNDNSDWVAMLPQGSDGWGYFPKSKYESFIKVFPENGGNTENPPCSSFVFESKGEDLVLYPFYAVTDGLNTNKIVFWVYNPADNMSYSDIVTTYAPTVLMPAGSMEIVGKAPGSFADYKQMYSESWGTTDTKSRPYIIHGVPEGWRIIFALESASEGYFYSIKELNDPSNSKSQNTIGAQFTKGQKYSMAGTATIGADTYLAFEDTWANGMYDCQDMSFAVYGAKTVDMNTGEGQAMGFVVAYEDLGSTLDMDYNDIVLRVEHVTRSSEEGGSDVAKPVTVSLLAAGGTMPVVPMYKEAPIFAGQGKDSGSTGEAHTVFGFSTDTPVNAGGSTASAVPVNAQIRVKEISPITEVAKDIVMQLNGGSSTMKYTNPQAWGVNEAVNNRTDNVPYAILISDPNWKWPAENVLISSVYPKFKTWVSDHNTETNWYEAEWEVEDIGTPSGDVIGIIALTTFYESQSISNINPEFLDDYCATGTTLHFVFDNANADASFTLKSESGTLTKEGTIGTDGKSSIALTGEDFKKIYYKNGTEGEKNTYYTISVFASKYGVSFGSEAEFLESDLNNVISDFIPADGRVITLQELDADGNGTHHTLVKSELSDFSEVVFTIRSNSFKASAGIGPYAYQTPISICDYSGFLTNRAQPVAGRPGIYRVALTVEELATIKSWENIYFNNFKDLSIAISGVEKDTPIITVPTSLNLADGETAQLTPSNTGNGVTYTFRSNNTDIATVDETGLVTAGSTSGTANITVTVAATDTNRSASANVTVNVTVDSRAESDLNVTSATKTITIGDTYQLVKGTDFTTLSTGQIRFSSNKTSIATISEDGIIETVAPGDAEITIEVDGDDNYRYGSKKIFLTVENVRTDKEIVVYENISGTTTPGTKITEIDASEFVGAVSVKANVETEQGCDGLNYVYFSVNFSNGSQKDDIWSISGETKLIQDYSTNGMTITNSNGTAGLKKVTITITK